MFLILSSDSYLLILGLLFTSEAPKGLPILLLLFFNTNFLLLLLNEKLTGQLIPCRGHLYNLLLYYILV